MAGEFDAQAKAYFDEAEYEKLIDPDAEAASKARFDWGPEVQAELLALLVKDRRHLAETGHLIKPH